MNILDTPNTNHDQNMDPNLNKRSYLSIFSLVAYAFTLLFSRIIVYLIEEEINVPFLGYNEITGYHIHHFAYGIILLAIVAFIGLFLKVQKYIFIIYTLFGVALGLIFDEFGIWIKLDDEYHQEVSTIAASVVGFALLVIVIISLKYPKHFEDYME
jgi:uncharacterized membrane protein